MSANLIAAIVLTASLVGIYAVLKVWYVRERLPAMTARDEPVCEFCGRPTRPCPAGLNGCVLGGRVHAGGNHYCSGAPDSAGAIEREAMR